MSTKKYITWIVLIAILSSIVTFPGYDTMIFAAPLWLWINIITALGVLVLNSFKAKQWQKEDEDLW